jgi:hypothetical protein
MNAEVLGIVGGVDGLDFGPADSLFPIASVKHGGNGWLSLNQA